jgi:magnesium transporter
MLICYYISESNIIKNCQINGQNQLPKNTIWVDAQTPSSEEESILKSELGISLPSQEDIWKNQILNRLYRDNEISYMTAAIITKNQSPHPEITPITFILTKDVLITLRTISPTSFNNFSQRIIKEPTRFINANAVLEGIMQEILSRVAFNTELVMKELDFVSHYIFDLDNQKPESKNNKNNSTNLDLKLVLKKLGTADDLNSKINESLQSISRLLNFFIEDKENTTDLKQDIQVLLKDTEILIQEASFISDKITFQLDATLGMINVEQNLIIKIFSVVAVFFLPPTLVSSIYGMNFKHMPELEWIGGYPFALFIMLMCAVVPFVFFKRKGWL